MTKFQKGATMKKNLSGIIVFLCALMFFIDFSLASDTVKVITPSMGKEIPLGNTAEAVQPIPDPIERFNRFFFKVNDKLYFWVFKPVAQGYGWVLPRSARLSVQNFFWNVYSPVRMVNCGLQGEFKEASVELSRFGINTTIGVAGLFDPAKKWFHLEMKDEDFGQTIGCYKGPGFYLTLPFAGSTSLRDGIGSFVDRCIVPSFYVLTHYSFPYVYGAEILGAVNRTSLRIGEYEALKRAALDPYVSVRDAYNQHREDLIKR